ncbi:hypothetical protein AgCh_000355 [Apium graveolens]
MEKIRMNKEKTNVDMEPTDTTMWLNRIVQTHRSAAYKKAMELYLEDVKTTHGFDIRHKPPQCAPGHKIFKIYDPPNVVPEFYTVNVLRCLSNLAISVYNKNKGTNYENVQVMMAMRYGCRDLNYNITFKASMHSKNTLIFQTKACFILHRPYHIVEIKFTRELSGKDRAENLSDSVFLDEASENFSHYLSEFALEEYNLDQLASSGFTMKEDAMYGSVTVLGYSWRKRKCEDEDLACSIKFEASLPKSTTVKSFRTKLHVSFYDSAAKFKVKYVRSKCSTN